MLNQKQIIEYAIKGIRAEIEKHEAVARKGVKFLEDIRQGKPVKTPKTEAEIKEIIRKHKIEVERLDKEKFDLEWELATNEEFQ